MLVTIHSLTLDNYTDILIRLRLVRSDFSYLAVFVIIIDSADKKD